MERQNSFFFFFLMHRSIGNCGICVMSMLINLSLHGADVRIEYSKGCKIPCSVLEVVDV